MQHILQKIHMLFQGKEKQNTTYSTEYTYVIPGKISLVIYQKGYKCFWMRSRICRPFLGASSAKEWNICKRNRHVDTNIVDRFVNIAWVRTWPGALPCTSMHKQVPSLLMHLCIWKLFEYIWCTVYYTCLLYLHRVEKVQLHLWFFEQLIVLWLGLACWSW